MKVIWPHTFMENDASSGIFMLILFKAMIEKKINVNLLNVKKYVSIKTILSNAYLLNKMFEEYDIVHAQYGSGCGYIISKVNKKKVLSLRGSDWYGFQSKTFMGRIHSKLSRFITLISVDKYDALIVMSERMKKEVMAYTSSDVYVVPSAIDLQQFYEMDKKEARKKLGYKNDESPWILFSTANAKNPLKRYDLARKSFDLVKKKIPDVRLKIMHGLKHEDVPFMINASDLILLTSTHEGWPNIIKEGLACNVPFVSTDVSDLESISDSEETCFVSSDDPHCISKFIIESLSKERPKNLRKYVQNMSKNEVSDKLLNIYKGLN